MADSTFLANVDHHMILEQDDLAFFSGARVDLKCVVNDGSGTVTAVTTSRAVPECEVVCNFPTWICQFFKQDDNFSVVDFNIDDRDGKKFLVPKGRDEVLPILHAKSGWDNIAEGFAGIGGWSYGSKIMGREPTLMVEQDEQTAFACAYTWKIPVLYPSEVVQCIQESKLPDRFVLIADMNSVICRVIAGVMKISTWLWSPPCQPWSKAGKLSGVNSPEGVAFVHAIMGLRLSKPRCINIENVPALIEHKDFQLLRHIFDKAGYQIACSTIDKVHPLLPIFRKRWLCTVFPKEFVVPSEKRVLAYKTVIPNEVPGIGKDTSIGSTGCVQSAIQPWELEKVLPDKDTLDLLSRYDLLPVNVRKMHTGVMTPDQVLQARTKSLRHCVPNVMAMQGSQHTLPIQHLQEKGLHAFLIDDGTNKRFSLPFEIAVAMGFGGNTTLPSDFVSAWRVTGNALSVPHAALQCFRSHIMMGDHSPFSCNFKGCFDLCEAFRSQQILLDDYEIRTDKEWMYLVDWSMDCTTGLSHPREVVEAKDETQIPRTKKAHVSPTWDFQEPVDNEIFQALPQPGEMIESFALNASKPEHGDMNLDDTKPMKDEEWENHIATVCEQQPHKSIVKIIHASGFWAHFVWDDGMSTIGEIIQQSLPHAGTNHFVCIRADGNDIRFGTKTASKWKVIVFEPRSITRIVQTNVHDKSIPVMLDVTWKFSDLVAYIAVEMAVLPQNMLVFNEMALKMKPDAFVLEDSSTHFTVIMTPGYTGKVGGPDEQHNPSQLEVNEIQPTVVDLTAASEHPDGKSHRGKQLSEEAKVRLAVRCPKWGSIRTAVFDTSDVVSHAIEVLLPHFQASDQPSFVCKEARIALETQLKDLLDSDDIEVFFPGGNVWPVTKLTMISVAMTFDCKGHSDHQEVESKAVIDVKGPFDYRSQKRFIPCGTNFVEVAASFVGSYEKAITLFVTQNGKGFDARTLIEEINPSSPVHVRACALPGGAKKKAEEIHDIIGKMLIQRGVPESEKASRVLTVTSKIPNHELKAVIQKDDKEAWDELKKLANQNKLRLITNQELKDHQKASRSSKNQTNESKVDKKKPANAASFVPKQVTIDVSLFHAGGCKIVTCDVGKFGPDMTGVAIVTPEQAEKFLPISRLSADPLALLVMSPKAIAGVEPVQIPAQDAKGNPILTYVVLLNFGDVRIELEHSLPSATITEVQMTILEIVIQRDKVNKWDDVQNPLNYLGLHLPEIRTGQVVSTWNLRSYDVNRCKCKHSDATYVHGFVKIPTAGVDTTLSRSGMAGIFIQAKGDNKKPDPAYGIVTMYGQTLEEVLKCASKTKDTLGVVQVSNGQFAIRGRREKIAEIRKKVMPQSIAIQEGNIEPNSQWWHLRNMHMSTTCDSLSQALGNLGWNASAIKPINKSTWLIAAKDEPPASHICINNHFVTVVPVMQKAKSHNAPSEPKMVPLALQGNFSMSPEDIDVESTAPSSTRMAEMKTELESTVSSMIEQRMKACDDRINSIQSTIDENNAMWKQRHEETQHAVQVVQSQVSGVESSIAAANGNMLYQMQDMFSKMQASLTAQLEHHIKENKRQKVES